MVALEKVRVIIWEGERIDLPIICDDGKHIGFWSRVGDRQAPYAVFTVLGWILHGLLGKKVRWASSLRGQGVKRDK